MDITQGLLFILAYLISLELISQGFPWTNSLDGCRINSFNPSFSFQWPVRMSFICLFYWDFWQICQKKNSSFSPAKLSFYVWMAQASLFPDTPAWSIPFPSTSRSPSMRSWYWTSTLIILLVPFRLNTHCSYSLSFTIVSLFPGDTTTPKFSFLSPTEIFWVQILATISTANWIKWIFRAFYCRVPPFLSKLITHNATSHLTL